MNYNTIQQAYQLKVDLIAKYPGLKEEVNDYYNLMIDNIEDGESVMNEVYLFEQACNDLIEESKL